MSSASIYCTRNSAKRLTGQKDYRTFINRHDPEPDAFLLFGKRTVPIYLVNSGEQSPAPTKDN